MPATVRSLFLLCACFCCHLAGAAQTKDTTLPPLQIPVDTTGSDVYNVKLKYELPAGAAFIVGSAFGFKALDKASEFSASDLLTLNPDDVNSFDRPVIFRDPAGFAQAQKNSDLFLNISIMSPLLLALDKHVRRDWLDLIALYLTTHAVDNTVYFATAFSVRRPRPFTYNHALPVEERIGLAKSNSFFSGHVSFSATSTFFLVKVYTDYRQIKGWKRLLLYTAAAVPPSLVGYYRMKAARHFKTDVILGFLVGAGSGILVPELHRHKNRDKRVSLSPFYAPQHSGVSLKIALR
ncbi:phosphatase PAP2 family protein [Chitinophaga japonensis]|uniref:Membrane-associated phospholipid phosphatase n=1 Tax=Chitinophaga japonensis TaxID=104662 RepID=A0A562SMI2_CHIJA|nr:phosphatase PAP2 family protein [Chitinophaga japonensis]TWI82517.1 membrane-associated phospholipid phosphatase [Chitinophaga japonensis]